MPAPPTRRNISSFFGRSSNVATTSVGRSIERIGRGTSTTKIVPQAPGAPGFATAVYTITYDGVSTTGTWGGGTTLVSGKWLPDGVGSLSVWSGAAKVTLTAPESVILYVDCGTWVGAGASNVWGHPGGVGFASIAFAGPIASVSGGGVGVGYSAHNPDDETYTAEVRIHVVRTAQVTP